MKHTFDYVARRRYISKNPSVGRRCSLSKGNSFAIGMVVGAGLVYCIVNRKEIRNMLLGLINSDSRSSAPNKFSYGIGEFERNGCQTNNHTTIFVFVNQTNVTNTTNITINSADSPHKKEDVRFSENNYTETSREPLSEDTVAASGSSVSQDSESVTPQSSGNPVSGEIFSGKEESCESSIPFPDDFPFPFYLSLSDDCIKELFDGMHGKYFHKKTSLEQFTYVLTGRGEKPKSGIPIEWIASPRSFSLFIGIVCAPYRDKWKICKGLFTGNINKNPSCDFNRMVSHDLVKNNRVSSTLKENARFISEKDNDLKSLLVLLSGFPTF